MDDKVKGVELKWTEKEEYMWRKLGFDDLLYNRLQREHRKPRTVPTLWDYIVAEKKKITV
jgi:hypothetical protein